MDRNGAEPDNINNQGANLKDLIVRPITSEEENDWNGLMAKHQYLGFRCLSGRSLKYVALLNGRWVALIGWGAAALKCSPRDRWINWSQERKYKRLQYITNNQRFLILPGVSIKNLASSILYQ